MRAITQDFPDLTGEYRRGPHLDEGAQTVAVHRFDHLHEPDRQGQLFREAGPDGGGVTRIVGGTRIGIDGIGRDRHV